MGRAWTRVTWRIMKVFKLLLIACFQEEGHLFLEIADWPDNFFFKQLQAMWLWQKNLKGSCMRNVFLIYLYPLVLALLTLIQIFQDDRQATLSYSDKQYDSFEIHSNVLQGYSLMTTVFGRAFSLLLCHSLLPIL